MATIIQFVEQSGYMLSYFVAGVYILAGVMFAVVRICMSVGLLREERNGPVWEFLANFR